MGLWEVCQLGDSLGDHIGDLLDGCADGVDCEERPGLVGQSGGGVAVEVGFGAGGGDTGFEAAVRATPADPVGGHGGVGGEDDRDVRGVGGGVERFDEH